MEAKDPFKMSDEELMAYAGSGEEAHQKVSVVVAQRLREAVKTFRLLRIAKQNE
jgi:ribonuclease P protein component